MSRTNSNQTLSNTSPFLIKKVIDATCGSEIEECKKTKNGQILIKTKNNLQANKLTTLIALDNNTSIEITQHKTLNHSKGVIYCNDLRGLQEDYILSELDTQNVIEVKKILKKSDYELIETGLIILTFETTNLPSEIRIGYEKVNVWPYIPLPLKCNNCLRYGHTAKICKAERTCANCASNYHLNDDMEEKCKNEEACINCIRQLQQPTNHIATDKKCPIFLKQKEIQAIKTTLKKDYKGALAIYNERHQHNQQPYSTI
ncbi:PREDICTED: uncharacterized protein LOC108356090, partial [Rhagoletis zephyria]|uniref:uncharacterized protein LOC108356090 n=1 Tax=Rhagoletis zephyria TaxID=28612 RepID=UPI000811483B